MDNPAADFKGECWNINVNCRAFVQEGEEKYSSSKALSAQHSVFKKNELMFYGPQPETAKELILKYGRIHFDRGMKNFVAQVYGGVEVIKETHFGL